MHPASARRLDGEKAIKLFAVLVCALVVIRHAWVSDDAFITLRTVRNLLDGNGPRWNLHERVQSYMHPLWMLVLAVGYGLLGEPVAAVFVLSLGFSILTLWWIAFRLRLSAPAAALAMAVLVSSKSFVDYATSGLENPLTHFLLVLLVGEHLREPRDQGHWVADSQRTAIRVTLLSALIAVNRMDAFLVALPLLVSAVSGVRASVGRAVKIVLAGFAPLIAWEVFAVIYYGFPFPNTAYAKLASDTPTLALWAQGCNYYISQIAFDPSSLLGIGAALLVLALGCAGRLRPLGIGMGFYLLYIVSIGGDFMAGRFFALPLLAGALLLTESLRGLLEEGPQGGPSDPPRASAIGQSPPALTRLARPGLTAYAPAALFATASILLTPHPTLSHDVDYALPTNPISKNFWDERGITDERAYYATSSSLLRTSRTGVIPDDWRRSRGLAMNALTVQAVAQVGATGFYAPPTAILVDGYGLCDAYLARLPAADKVTWRIGHFGRLLPDGYLESIREGRNLISKPDYAWGYERVKRVVSGPIWSWERWKEIVRLNLNLASPPMPQPPPGGSKPPGKDAKKAPAHAQTAASTAKR